MLAPLADLLLTIALGVAGYFLLSVFAVGAWVLSCEYSRRCSRDLAERLAFEEHADHELREHLRVVGGNGTSSDERWGRAA